MVEKLWYNEYSKIIQHKSDIMTACDSAKGDTGVMGIKDNRIFTASSADIAEKMGVGWNCGNTLEANFDGTPSETVWGNPKTSQEIIDAVADAGFNTIRIPITYLSKIDDKNGYMIDHDWLERIAEVVDYCYKRDMFVIINIHGDAYHTINGGWLLCDENDQDMIKKKFRAVWRQVAERFADLDEHLIFESMNEVFDGVYHDPVPEYYVNINDYNRIFVDTVRECGKNNTHRWLMVCGWNTNIDYTCGDYGFCFPEDKGNTADEGRLILSVHFYDPWDYCGEEGKDVFLWGEKGQRISDEYGLSPDSVANWGDESHMQFQFEKLKKKYIDKGIPVVLGEFGCIDKGIANEAIAGKIEENRAYYNGFVAGTAAMNGITPIYWDNGFNGKYGLALFDRRKLTQTQPAIIEAIVKGVKNKDPMAGLCTGKKQN